jgi:4-diphosphocytidyl-2-C-methyl-D-erythritol kinase
VRLELKSHAKINLTLEVLYRREDGYHQLKTVLQELALHDTLFLEEFPGGSLELLCDDKTLPRGEENLAYRAALLLQSLYAPGKGARMELIKRIPVAAGLGGGSSNAAAVLTGLNQLWNLSLEVETLVELGARLGSDVPFFIYGGTALAEGRGEQIKPLPSFQQAKVLLVAPKGKGLSAAEVYSSLNLDKIPGRTNTNSVVELLEEGCHSRKDPFGELLKLICNDLETAVFTLEEDVFFLKEQLLRKGLAALVSGSGPTVFALSRDEKALREAGKELSLQGHRVIFTETVQKKKYIIEKKYKDGDTGW